ncbi:hypothetical protein C8R45DRAFT_1073369 [Mycena sanguinolenta]|nr:hypothetical protein C8R45DRAFT_1073369 [Mycena sanguinolenta]
MEEVDYFRLDARIANGHRDSRSPTEFGDWLEKSTAWSPTVSKNEQLPYIVRTRFCIGGGLGIVIGSHTFPLGVIALPLKLFGGDLGRCTDSMDCPPPAEVARGSGEEQYRAL